MSDYVTVAYPFHTVRSCLMMMSGEGEKMYKGTTHCWMKIAKEEGAKALIKGSFANILNSIGCTPVLVLYDGIIAVLKTHLYMRSWSFVPLFLIRSRP